MFDAVFFFIKDGMIFSSFLVGLPMTEELDDLLEQLSTTRATRRSST